MVKYIRINKAWKENKAELVKSSNNILNKLKNYTRNEQGDITGKAIDDTYKYFKEYFDPVFGGMGNAPHFEKMLYDNALLATTYVCQNKY